MVVPLLALGGAMYYGYKKYQSWVAPKRIIVFGFSASGKTSLINTLTGNNDAVGNYQTIGTSFENKCVTYRRKNQDYQLWDTPGLNDFAALDLPPAAILNSLTDLMKNTSEGVNLLIFVVKVSELKKPEIRNQYDLIVNQLTQNRIPVILVVTNCEQNIQSEGSFEEQCQSMFDSCNSIKLDGMKFCARVGTCFASSDKGKYGKLKNQSANKVWTLIEERANDSYIPYFSGFSGTDGILWKWYNSAVKSTGANFNPRECTELISLFERLGFNAEQAKRSAEQLTS